MAAVIYNCEMCLHFWPDIDQPCPKCGSHYITSDWVEEKDFKHPELDGFYERNIESDDD